MTKIQWLVENFEHVLAVIGAAYALALLIVKLTPTPKDDEALEKVSVLVRSVAGLFRLKIPTQEEKDRKATLAIDQEKKGEGGRALVDLLIVLTLGLAMGASLTGCRSAGDAYQASSMSFMAAVDTASELRKADMLEPSAVAAIDSAVGDGAAVLTTWGERLKAGEDYPEAEDLVRLVVERIRPHLVARKRE